MLFDDRRSREEAKAAEAISEELRELLPLALALARLAARRSVVADEFQAL